MGMEVKLDRISKRYISEYIFKNVSFHFKPGLNYAIKGANGTGKSTLLKIISSNLTPSKGEIDFHLNNQKIPLIEVYKQITYAAPYMDVIEEYTLDELLRFHVKLKPLRKGVELETFKEILNFKRVKSKYISAYSSGMKQRLKLALSILSEASLILLDEPTSNLDNEGKIWYKTLIRKYTTEATVLIASNEDADFVDCVDGINIESFK
ncbi:MAG: ABC transporter ATP-binding protein [Bacteroidota bacterium]